MLNLNYSHVLTAFALLIFTGCASPGNTVEQTDQSNVSIDQKIDNLQELEGFYTLYHDEQHAKLYMKIDRWDEEFLYFTSLAGGAGTSSPLLDRGQRMNEYIGSFTRNGQKVFLELQNPKFTNYDTDNQALTRSVRQSFATSVVGSFDIVAEEDQAVLIDVTDYFLRDEIGAAGRLSNAGNGTYRVERDKSAINMAATEAFPENTEIQSKVTFETDQSSWNLGYFTPDSRNVTLHIHHSMVKLPDDDFTPRKIDPRVGYFSVDRYDYSRNFDEDYVQRYAARHRLQKEDPDAEVSEPVEPITYYMDPAIPEPYRQAFIDGIEWFEGLFEEAGFKNAFEVKDMPEDMNPMDARYNVVLWVHRTNPGPSVGPSFRDPRTGEIIKASVRMDSHRSLVNYDMFRSYAPSFYHGGTADLGEWVTNLDDDVTAEEFTMARRRQHAAHEVGHTLGLAHNFIAESYGRASVMDYPAPKVQLKDGQIDLSEAYAPGPGVYDTLAIKWGYSEFPEGEEEEGLESIIQDMVDRDIEYITHPYHGSSGSHPRASTWMLGEDVLEEFRESLEIRSVLLENFDESVIDEGEPLWLMNERLNPAYMFHRYILSATIKHLGGYEFQYSMKGDGRGAGEVIEAERVEEALTALMDAVEPENLKVPDHIVDQMAPTPDGYSSHDRNIDTGGGPAFDQLDPARMIASTVFDGLFHHERAARTIAFADRDPSLPHLDDAIEYMLDRTFVSESDHPGLEGVRQRALTNALIDLAANGNAVAEARASAEYGLDLITEKIEEGNIAGVASHHRKLKRDIERYFQTGETPDDEGRAPDTPSGFPIGDQPYY